MAGEVGLEPTTNGFGVAPEVKKTLILPGFLTFFFAKLMHVWRGFQKIFCSFESCLKHLSNLRSFAESL